MRIRRDKFALGLLLAILIVPLVAMRHSTDPAVTAQAVAKTPTLAPPRPETSSPAPVVRAAGSDTNEFFVTIEAEVDTTDIR